MEGVLHSLSMCELSLIISAYDTLFNPAKLFNVGTHRFQPRKFRELQDCISVTKYCIPLSSSVVSYTICVPKNSDYIYLTMQGR